MNIGYIDDKRTFSQLTQTHASSTSESWYSKMSIKIGHDENASISTGLALRKGRMTNAAA
jgi:hypothetical protein